MFINERGICIKFPGGHKLCKNERGLKNLTLHYSREVLVVIRTKSERKTIFFKNLGKMKF